MVCNIKITKIKGNSAIAVNVIKSMCTKYYTMFCAYCNYDIKTEITLLWQRLATYCIEIQHKLAINYCNS